jgi:signal transduction histidine kinase
MEQGRQSWRLAVFVGAILLPSAALVIVSQRTMQQNRELAQKHRLDERQAAKERIAREMLTRLDSLRAAIAQNPETPWPREVALAARIEGERLLLPGDLELTERAFREATDRSPGFREAIRRGERAEFEHDGLPAAVRSYTEALRLAASPLESAYARYQLAVTLSKQGRSAAAMAEARQLLEAPLELVDQDGIPLCVRAAGLPESMGSPQDRARIRQVTEAALEGGRWHSSIAVYAARVADQLKQIAPAEDTAWDARIRGRVEATNRLQEQAQALQSDPVLQKWQNHAWTLRPGAEPWLVSVHAPGGRPQLAIAVRAAEFFQPFEAAAKARFFPSTEPGGELLADTLPGVKVRFLAETANPSDSGAIMERVYYAAVLLLVGATAFGTSMLWRSLRREVELAEMRSQFVASVSHELKTPLTAIRMFAETLQMGRPRDQAVQNEYLETITNECDRLARLVDNVLLFSKLEQGRLIFRFQPTEIADTLRTAARTLAYPLAEHGFTLRMDVDQEVPPVDADADALEQAVLNLVTNAMKYSGGQKEIDLRLYRQDGDACIQVTDRGSGIAPDDLPHIFDKYYRAPTAENRTIPGTGLGLTLVAEIARAHGGRVDVKSVPGEGSSFTLRLPLRSES